MSGGKSFTGLGLAVAAIFLILISYLFLKPKPQESNPIQVVSKSKPEDVIQPLVTTSPPLPEDSLVRAITDNFEFLNKMILPSGKYIYTAKLIPEFQELPGYNIVRHAGTTFALAHYANRNPTIGAYPEILRTIDYLKARSVERLDQDLVVIYELKGADQSKLVKLGSLGLGLVAMTSVERIQSGYTPTDTLEGIANFILKMQSADGRFVSRYDNKSDQRDTSWFSLYFPGEAALGLVTLYELNPNEKWLDAACKALEYLADEALREKTYVTDHWAVIAISRLIPFLRTDPASLALKNKLERHASRILEIIILEDKVPGYENRFWMNELGDYYPTTALATRLEAVSAAYGIIPDSDRINKSLMATFLHHGIRNLVKAQIPEGPNKGAMLKWPYLMKESSEQTRKLGITRQNPFRIDYNQHSLSAMMAYQGIFY